MRLTFYFSDRLVMCKQLSVSSEVDLSKLSSCGYFFHVCAPGSVFSDGVYHPLCKHSCPIKKW